MRITVLMDNYTDIDVYYLGEPAVSYWIEADGQRFLFDTGYSDAFLKNAAAMGIDLHTADGIVLSHGHNDHTGGLVALQQYFAKQEAALICHPHSLLPRSLDGLSIGSPLGRAAAAAHFRLRETTEPLWLTENLVYLGEIPQTTAFEAPYAIGTLETAAGEQPDFVLDDTALAYRTAAGLYLITGCSHAGICNIISYAKRVTGQEKVLGLLGGLHLLELDERAEKTLRILEKEKIERLAPCHCTSFQVRAALDALCPLDEIGVGKILECV